MAKRSILVGDTANLIPLRLVVGAVFIMHGGRTIFFNGIPWFATYLETQGLPYAIYFAVIVSVVELAGGAALVIGLYPKLAAFLLAVDMAVAFFLVHMQKGFFVQEGGFELVMVLFAACLVFLIGPPRRGLRM